MAHPKTARSGLAFFWSILAFCLVGILVLIVRSPLTSGQSYEDKRAELRISRLKVLRADDEKKLNTYAWLDKAKGIVQIPIDQAMALTVVELGKKGVTASTVKAEPNMTNVTPPYLQAKPAAPVK